MNIINRYIPYINTYNHEKPTIAYLSLSDPPPAALLCLKETELIKQEFWYCMLTTEKSLRCFDIKNLIGKLNVNRAINKEILIIFDCSFEPFLKIIDSIYEEVVLKCQIPSSQIIFISNMFDVAEYNISVAHRLNQDPIGIFWFSALELMIKNFKIALPKTLEIKEYNKKFLNLNRRWRIHRPLLVLLLRYKNLLDKGFVSFGPAGENFNSWDSIWDGLKVLSIGNNEIFNAIDQSESIKTMPPLYLDTNELHINRAKLTDSTIKYYEDSYFSLVSETTFYNMDVDQNSRFITEKTFKAIAMLHPFIIVSLPNSLEVLKYLGYKTFSPWIDESYDLEFDDNKRMLMIINEVERLCNLSKEDLESFLIETKKICIYNYNILHEKKQFIYEKNNV